jgi:glycosyltransferase involved in cell wall biosynthesis
VARADTPARGAPGRDRRSDVDVLSLVTTGHSRFYRQQVDALADRGVSTTTVVVPGDDGERSPLDYARFYPSVLARSLGGDWDLVHANFGLTAPHALAQPGRPVVLSLWGTDVYGDYGWVSRACAPHVDELVVMSERMAEAVDVPARVVPHGVDLSRFRPLDRSTAKERVGWDQGTRQVLFPYPPSRGVKNHDLAARVVDRAADRVPGPVALQTLSGVPHERMSDYYNAAHALLLTSDWEGSPNSVKEALACNVPVVARDVGDVPERLDGVAHSRACRSEDALVEALVDVLRAGARSDGRRAVADLSLDHAADRLRATYDRALGR